MIQTEKFNVLIRWYLDQVLLHIQEHLHIPVHPRRILQVKSAPERVGRRKSGLSFEKL